MFLKIKFEFYWIITNNFIQICLINKQELLISKLVTTWIFSKFQSEIIQRFTFLLVIYKVYIKFLIDWKCCQIQLPEITILFSYFQKLFLFCIIVSISKGLEFGI